MTTFKINARKSIFAPFISLVILSCHSKGEEEKSGNFTVSNDTIVVSSHAKVKSLLKTIKVETQEYQPELLSAGTVKAIPNLYAEIAPPFSGRVTAVHLRLGLKTKAGTPLFEMTSAEFTDAQKLFFQAKSEYQNAKLTMKRQQDLKAHGVGAEKDVEEAETNYQIKQKEYQNAMASLKIFNVDINKLVFGQPLVVRSPIAGEVITNEVVMGQFIKADDPPRAKVAELDKVWVVGMVKEKDLRFIQGLDNAEVSIAAFPDKKIKGSIYHIDEIVNEDTRSVQVLIECSNTDHLLKPGMYVTVKFMDKSANATFVPEKSLLQYNDKSYVLLQIGKDQYIKRHVQTGITEKGKIQILSGLTNGDIIISEGAFYLLDAK